MKRFKTLMLSSLLGISALNSFGQNCAYGVLTPGAELSNLCDEPSLNNWSLVFEDNFDSPTLNTSKWQSGLRWSNYAGNTLFKPENITFDFPGEMYLKVDTMDTDTAVKGIPWEDSAYTLTLYKETDGTVVTSPNKRIWHATAGGIISKRLFKYGKFEIRCNLPDKKQHFPAFWMFAGPTYSEVDIFEFKGKFRKTTNNMHHNLNNNYDDRYSCGDIHNPPFSGKFTNEWHTYSCEWDQWKIKFFVDGSLLRTVYRYLDGFYDPIESISTYNAAYPFIFYNKAFPTRPMRLLAGTGLVPGKEQIAESGTIKVDYIRAWTKNIEWGHLGLNNPNYIYQPSEDHRYTPSLGPFNSHVEYVKEAESSNFADGHGGDFNGDGIDEFVSLRNLDGHVIIHSINKQGGKFLFKETGRYTGAWGSSEWAGVSCGDVDNDGLDEIVAVRNSDGYVFIWDVNDTSSTTEPKFQIVSKCAYTLASSSSDWRGVECGDFDKDGVDEIALVRNLDQRVFIWEYDNTSNSIVGLAAYSGFGSGSNFADLTAGDFNGDGRDEIAVVRNLDGNLYILELNSANQPYVRIAYTAPSPTVNWTSISAGKYKSQNYDQIIIHGKRSNLLTMVDAINSVTPVASDYPCTIPVAIGSGRFDGPCEKFVIMNNLGEYELKSISSHSGCASPIRGKSAERIEGRTVLAENEFTLYPNPTSDLVTMSFKKPLTGKYKIIASDGKVITEGNLNALGNQLQLDISSYPPGLYTVFVITKEKSMNSRIIKQ